MATLVAPFKFSPNEDAEVLHKACKGWGTDEEAIISILGHRNATQRKQIRKAYEDLFQEDLIKRLESELKGDFERAVYRWILDPPERDAVLANVALKKMTPDYHVIIEIACVRSPEELFAIRRAYQVRYKHSLEEDVAYYTSGDIRKLLVGLVSAYRYDGSDIDARLANKEADKIHSALKDKAYNHDEVTRILTTRSKAQFMAIFNRYREDNSISISKELLGDPKNELAVALLTTIRCLTDPKKYFEKVIRNSIKKIGTDEDALSRVIVTRAEKDLKDIKALYYKKNSVPLAHAVAKDTSGDYKSFLLTLLGSDE